MKPQCPVCGNGGTAELIRYLDGPVLQNVLCRTREEALALPKDRMVLSGCPA